MFQPDDVSELSSLTPSQFEALLPEFDARWQARHADRAVNGQSHMRNSCGHNSPVLHSSREKFVFIIFYAKYYPSPEAMALIFGLSQGQVSHWLSRLTPVAVATFGQELIDPARRPASLAELFDEVPDLLTVIKQAQTREVKVKTQPLAFFRPSGPAAF